MRQWWIRGLVILLYGALLVGCRGGTTSSGVFEVAITDEDKVTVQGNLCAVKGEASNLGNVRLEVVALEYQALNSTGGVIGTATTASFEVAPFSKKDFTTAAFSNGLACAEISNFRRSKLDVKAA